jgi:sortase A
MMTLALALVIAVAVVVGVTLGSEPERVVAAEVATKSPGEAPRNSSGEEGSATKKSPGEKESPRYPSEEESLGYGSSSSGGPVGQQEEQAKEPQPVLQQEDAEPQNSQSPMPQPGNQQTSPEAPSGPQPQPYKHQPHQEEQPLLPGSEVGQCKEEANEPQPVLQEEAQTPNSQSEMPQSAGQQTPSEVPSEPEPQPQRYQPHQQEQPLPGAEQSEAPSGPQSQLYKHQTDPQEQPLLSGAEKRDWPKPTQGELQSANRARRYEVLPGATMGLTIEAIGIYDAPVFDSKSQWALANGVAHHSQTSLPWSPTAQRNVYLAGHRMGFRGTWSRMIFYNLHKLGKGDEVVLKDRAGRSYRYRVSEVLVVDPTDSWVMGQVRGRDMVTLQTCTPYPTFHKRLIIRADRV